VQAIGWLVFGTAMLLVVLHRDAARAYLGAFEARYGTREPGASWLVRRDADPGVERLRRRRLMFAVPASVLTMTGIVLLVMAPR
jgi:hypothetical protein